MRLDDLEKLEQVIATAPERSAERAEAMAELGWNIWAADYPRAEQLSREALEIAEEGGYMLALACAKRNVGLLLYQGANLQESMGHLNDALQWFEANNHTSGEADVRIGLAYLYWGFGEFNKGLDEGLKALALYKEADNLDGQGWSQTALGGFYHDWKDHRQSRDYYEQALVVFEETGHQVGIGRALNGIGSALALMGQYEEARDYQERSLKANRSGGNQFTASKALNDIGLLLQQQGELDEALKYHREALEIRQQLSYPTGEITCLLDIGNIQIEKREYDEARDVLNKALVMAERIRSKPKICRAHELLSKLYRDLVQFDTALVHFENFHRIREEVYHEDTETRLSNMRTAYQIEAAEREAELYRLKNVELKDMLAQLQNAQAQLVQTGKMAALGQLVAGITHEVNQPIGAIRSATDVSTRALKRIGSDGGGGNGELEKLINVLRLNNDNTAIGTARIEKILKSLQSFSRLDEADFQKTDIHEGLESTLTLIGPEIPEGVRVEKDFGDVPSCYLYPGDLNQLFMNLLLNAVAAVDGEGVVKIKTRASGGAVNIEISDDGRGIENDKLKSLFDPGFTTRESRVRMRTGLYTSYGIVHKHHGEIEVESELGKGTTFTVTIPDRLETIVQ
jgi:signal transduction histidine kinase/Tfp pilus assembly protein PilF